jgi:putative ABC transport system substrate-binding protein
MNFRTIIRLLMPCFLLLLPAVLTAEKEPKVWLVNSDARVEKYKIAQEEFKRTFARPVFEVNLNEKRWDITAVEEALYDESPNLVYCIGSKAYLVANKFAAEKPVVFSSIINWQRLPLAKKTYGVSNELPSEMQLTLFRYVFPQVKKIGIVYSEQYNKQWFEKTREEAKKIGIEIHGQAVSSNTELARLVSTLLPAIDALWMISDPLIISDKKMLTEVFKACDKKKVPVFTYQDVFTEYGAVLIISVDDATIGRQSARMSNELLAGGTMAEQVQYPAGSHIILNLKKAKEFGLPYNEQALGVINQIIK